VRREWAEDAVGGRPEEHERGRATSRGQVCKTAVVGNGQAYRGDHGGSLSKGEAADEAACMGRKFNA